MIDNGGMVRAVQGAVNDAVGDARVHLEVYFTGVLIELAEGEDQDLDPVDYRRHFMNWHLAHVLAPTLAEVVPPALVRQVVQQEAAARTRRLGNPPRRETTPLRNICQNRREPGVRSSFVQFTDWPLDVVLTFVGYVAGMVSSRLADLGCPRMTAALGATLNKWLWKYYERFHLVRLQYGDPPVRINYSARPFWQYRWTLLRRPEAHPLEVLARRGISRTWLKKLVSRHVVNTGGSPMSESSPGMQTAHYCWTGTIARGGLQIHLVSGIPASTLGDTGPDLGSALQTPAQTGSRSGAMGTAGPPLTRNCAWRPNSR